MVSKATYGTKEGEIEQEICYAFLHAKLDLENFLKYTVKVLVDKFPVECAEIRLVDDRNPELLVCKPNSICVRGKPLKETMDALGIIGCKVAGTFIGKVYKDSTAFTFDEKTDGPITKIENVDKELLNKYLEFFPSKTIKHFIAIPLIRENRSGEKKSIGCLRVTNKTDHRGSPTKAGFTEEEREFLKEIASKISLALDDLLRVKDEEEELQIKAIIDQIPNSPKLDEVMDKIQNSLCDYFASKVSTVWGYDKQNKKLVLRYLKGLELRDVPLQILDQDKCLIGETVITREPKHVLDITLEELLDQYQWRKIVDKLESKQLLALPFVNSESEVIGVISLHPSDDFKVTSKDIEIIKTFADKATYSIEYARLRWRELQLKTLVDRLAILETEKIDYFFENIVELVQMVTSARACSLFTVDHGRLTLKLVATTDRSKRDRIGKDIYEFSDKAITVRVAVQGKTVMCYDVSKERESLPKFLEEVGGPHKAFVAVPIKDRTNKTIAVLRCINKQKTEISPTEYFRPDDEELLTLIATVIAKFIESAEMVKMRHEYTQTLTHEILAPATGIMSHAEYLLKNLENPDVSTEKKKIKLQDILNDCEFLNFLVKGPRSLEQTLGEYQFSNVDIYHDVIIPRIIQLRPTALSEGVEISYASYERLLFRLDRNKFDEIIFNLLHNAVKYSYKNTTIEVKLCEKRESYQITFENYGIGVKEGEEEKILEAYFRTEEAKMKHPTGKGLGLYIVKTICKNLKLEIKLAQRENPTVFALILPKDLLVRRIK